VLFSTTPATTKGLPRLVDAEDELARAGSRTRRVAKTTELEKRRT
jgi:hypothetical protein